MIAHETEVYDSVSRRTAWGRGWNNSQARDGPNSHPTHRLPPWIVG